MTVPSYSFSKLQKSNLFLIFSGEIKLGHLNTVWGIIVRQDFKILNFFCIDIRDALLTQGNRSWLIHLNSHNSRSEVWGGSLDSVVSFLPRRTSEKLTQTFFALLCKTGKLYTKSFIVRSVRNLSNYEIFLKLSEKYCFQQMCTRDVQDVIWISSTNLFNPFIPNALFLYPLKTSENGKVFWCFQGDS